MSGCLGNPVWKNRAGRAHCCQTNQWDRCEHENTHNSRQNYYNKIHHSPSDFYTKQGIIRPQSLKILKITNLKETVCQCSRSQLPFVPILFYFANVKIYLPQNVKYIYWRCHWSTWLAVFTSHLSSSLLSHVSSLRKMGPVPQRPAHQTEPVV